MFKVKQGGMLYKLELLKPSEKIPKDAYYFYVADDFDNQAATIGDMEQYIREHKIHRALKTLAPGDLVREHPNRIYFQILK